MSYGVSLYVDGTNGDKHIVNLTISIYKFLRSTNINNLLVSLLVIFNATNKLIYINELIVKFAPVNDSNI